MVKKNYKTSSLYLVENAIVKNDPLRIQLPRNPTTQREIDFTRYLGFGFDAWVDSSATVIAKLLSAGNHSITTLLRYSTAGLGSFIEFLNLGLMSAPPEAPRYLTKLHLESFISWLKVRHPNGSTAKSRYFSFKGLVLALSDYGFIVEDLDDLIPGRAFPNACAVAKGASPFSLLEMRRLMAALKIDLVAIHKGFFAGSDAEAMTVMLLVIAARTGINTTPLLEMTRNDLKPHPFIPSLRIISTFKRRGKGSQLGTIRQTNIMDSHNAIPLDGVAVLNKAIEISAKLAESAPDEIKNNLWLYRFGQLGARNKIAALTAASISSSAKRICKRHSLKGDDGRPLGVSVSRLRKTMEGRLWQLSRGDILEVSSVMGHNPAVADNHYLSVTEDLKLDGARFIGQAFVSQLQCADITPIPSGNCKDTLHGAKAPKDGFNHCSEFNQCLTCPSYAIVGTEDDLYRLFSYQRFLIAASDYYLSEEWQGWRAKEHGYVKMIDEFTSRNFKTDLVSRAKARAEEDPHKFWASKIDFLKRKSSGLL